MFYQSSCQLFEVEPSKILVQRVSLSTMRMLQGETSKAIWRPSPGRNMSFVIMHHEITIGLLHLTSPVINLGERDKFLGLSSDPIEKGNQLRHYMDMSVCVGYQPLAWYWNIGKLIALLAPTLGDFALKEYGDELKGITTTSLWGKGSQYNRIYKFLGYTKGFGHEQYSNAKYHEMTRWLRKNGHELSSGTNVRMSNIQKYRRLSGDSSVNVFHGKQRGIYYHESTSPEKRQEVIQSWYERWGLKRYENKKNDIPPYIDGKGGE